MCKAVQQFVSFNAFTRSFVYDFVLHLATVHTTTVLYGTIIISMYTNTFDGIFVAHTHNKRVKSINFDFFHTWCITNSCGYLFFFFFLIEI